MLVSAGLEKPAIATAVIEEHSSFRKGRNGEISGCQHYFPQPFVDAGLPLVDRVLLIIKGDVLGDGRNLNEATFVTFDVVDLKRRVEVKVLTALQDGLWSEPRATV